MSHTAPKHQGYPYSGGGFGQYLSGARGLEYKTKGRHTEAASIHQLAKANPKQNQTSDNDNKIEGKTSGSVAGVVLNEIIIGGPDAQKLAPPKPVDRNGPHTDAVAMGMTSGTAPGQGSNVSMEIKKMY